MAILNTVTGAVAAYSLRLINSSYTGKCIKVRRSSDNAEQDIAFDTNGYLSNNSKIEDGSTSFSSWYGSDSVYITIWYDQSGNTRNAAQTTTTKQPRIVNAGTLDVDANSKPIIVHSTSTLLNIDVPLSSACTICNVFVKGTEASSYGTGSSATTGRGPAIIYNFTTTLVEHYTNSDRRTYVTDPGTTNNNIYIAKQTDGSRLDLYYNGSSAANKVPPSTNWNGVSLRCINTSDGTNDIGNIKHSEFIVFDSAISDTNRQLLETDQSAYYGITVTTIAISPPLLTIGSTFYEPTITTGSTDVQIDVPLLTITQTYYEPNVNAGVTISVPLLTLAQTLFNPEIYTGVTITVPLLTAGSTFYEPEVNVGITTTVPMLTIGSTFYTPTINTGETITVQLLLFEITSYDPTVNIGMTVTTPLLTIAQTYYTPSIIIESVEVIITVPLLTITQTYYTPTIAIGVTVVIPLLLINITFYNPIINSSISEAKYKFIVKTRRSNFMAKNKKMFYAKIRGA